MKQNFRLVVCMSLLVVLAGPVFAQKKVVTIKLASIVPENTPWGMALTKLARDWSTVTNGEVELKVYHNGVAGSEQDVLRKLKQNQIQAGVFSSVGMSTISSKIMTVSSPFLIRTDAELDLVLKELKQELEQEFIDQKFQPLTWALAGWVKFFSRSPVFVPADLKKQKVGTASDQPELMQTFKTMGYQMVPVELNEVLISLNSGMIDAVYQSPLAAGGFQFFGIAKNMASINLAPMMGSIIINQRGWRAIPDQYKDKLLELGGQLSKDMNTSILKLEADAIATMLNYGLIINSVSPEQTQLWYTDVEQAMPRLLGKTFDRELYGKIQTLLGNYRNRR
ncbi:MAG: TRAP transporter substrate-binding protein DctP [Treponema sp.]|jgi:TRAP-type C4-dicarboxylate transport system substrate-binding protein|nr:TRAP transporter substrate-binding protein DctP [Treponema sp.]